MKAVKGIHHITAIAGDPQENLDFYVGVLGMRLVKRSVNQDVPDTYHFFFADQSGNPGTDLTFFPWPELQTVRRGTGQWDEVYLGVPPGTLSFWEDRLNGAGRITAEKQIRFGESYLPFEDPHGLRLSLVESKPYSGFRFDPWNAGPVPKEKQIFCLAGVRVLERSEEATGQFLSNALGFNRVASEDGWQRHVLGDGKAGQRIDIRIEPTGPRGQWGVGAIHHVAWRVEDQDQQREVRQAILDAGGRPTEVIDRFWFRSVYSLEPGGALLEVATDGPGFGVDEDLEHLGETLVLPDWLEPQRKKIEAALPAVRMSDSVTQR